MTVKSIVISLLFFSNLKELKHTKNTVYENYIQYLKYYIDDEINHLTEQGFTWIAIKSIAAICLHQQPSQQCPSVHLGPNRLLSKTSPGESTVLIALSREALCKEED